MEDVLTNEQIAGKVGIDAWISTVENRDDKQHLTASGHSPGH
jgi:hypothetical protein